MPPSPSHRVIVRIASPEDLQPLLPRMLDSLSIARGQMLLDQLTGIVESKRLDQIVLLVAEMPAPKLAGNPKLAGKTGDGDGNTFDGNLRAVAVLQTGGPEITIQRTATATVLFAGTIGANDVPSGTNDVDVLGQALGNTIDDLLSSRGVEFIQWAQDIGAQHGTDLLDPLSPSLENGTDIDANVQKNQAEAEDIWAKQLGFQRLAELLYLRQELGAESDQAVAGEHTSQVSLRLSPISHELEAASAAYENLVEQTYAETLDCPELSEMLSTRAILDGYRLSRAYAPELWFEAWWSPSGSATDEIIAGCLILARHGTPPARATEIVYMGIVPEHRGHGLGAQLVERASHVARAEKSESLILAVDRRNRPARAAYDAAGFVPILFEEVWGKRLSVAKIEASPSEST